MVFKQLFLFEMAEILAFDEAVWNRRKEKLKKIFEMPSEQIEGEVSREKLWKIAQQGYCNCAGIVIAFLKSIKEFQDLSTEDQIICIKHNINAIIELISLSTYDLASNTFNFMYMSWKNYWLSVPYFPELDEMFNKKIRVAPIVGQLHLDLTELTILCSICATLDQRATYRNPGAVARFRDNMTDQLQLYEEKHKLAPLRRHWDLLEMLQELRLVTHVLQEMVQSMYNSDPGLHPISQNLFQEIVIFKPRT